MQGTYGTYRQGNYLYWKSSETKSIFNYIYNRQTHGVHVV